jgi:hypothetical protein
MKAINHSDHNKVEISNYWRLNQLYLEFALFGQYAGEVFISIYGVKKLSGSADV